MAKHATSRSHPRRRPTRRAVVAGLAVTALVVPAAAIAATQHEDNLPDVLDTIDESALEGRNVILLIGDGMDDSALTMTRNDEVGAAGTLALDEFPFTGAMATYSVQQDDPSMPDYVSESASTASAWATGQKTYDGAIAVAPDGTHLDSTLDLANEAGYLTGIVTTAEMQDATPASQIASVAERACKGPDSIADCPLEDVENGGPGSISEQLIDSGAHLILGGGRTYLEETIRGGDDAGKSVWSVAQEQGWETVSTARELRRVRGDKPVIGAFAETNMDLLWTGPTPTLEGTEPETCQLNKDKDRDQPTLSELTETSLDILDAQTNTPDGAPASSGELTTWRERAETQGRPTFSAEDGSRTGGGGQDDDRGFFLQIEGASIDKQAHASNPCGQIGENVEFDEAVRVALDYQEADPGASQQHTGGQIRIAAKGPQSTNVLGVTDQTEIFATIDRALGLTPSE